ncbi:MAG: F0F1 ATP synthase subunit A [Patescibacteria group bacterium]
MHIPEMAPDVLFHIGSVPVTNTIVNTWIAIVVFLIIGLYFRKHISLRPGKLQNVFEFILESILGFFDQVTGDRKKTLKFLPLVGSVFFFILLSNWLGLLPGTGSITYGGKMLLRPANTDLNLVFAMTLVTLIVSHVWGMIAVGFFTYVGKFIQIKPLVKSFRKGPIAILTAFIELFVGLLEIISELAKVLSLSFRLFGNIFAGEILITVMSSLVSFLVPTPFMFLELLVGLIQAGVFAILSLVYLTTATTKPHTEEAV